MLIEKIGNAAMLEQTAEECVELAQACLKYARYLRGENKPHKKLSEIQDNLAEEIADVALCIKELRHGKVFAMPHVDYWIDCKKRRMQKRLYEDEKE